MYKVYEKLLRENASAHNDSLSRDPLAASLTRTRSTIFQRRLIAPRRTSRRLSLAHARLCRFALTPCSGVSLNACIQRVFLIRVHQAELHSRVPPRRRQSGPDIARFYAAILYPRAAFSTVRRSRRPINPELRTVLFDA